MSTAQRQLHRVRRRVHVFSARESVTRQHNMKINGWVIPPAKSLGVPWDRVVNKALIARTMYDFTRGHHDSKLLGRLRRHLLTSGKLLAIKAGQVDMACFIFFAMRAHELRLFFRCFCTHASRRGNPGLVDWSDLYDRDNLLLLLDELVKVSKETVEGSASLFNALLFFLAPSAFAKYMVKCEDTKDTRPSSTKTATTLSTEPFVSSSSLSAYETASPCELSGTDEVEDSLFEQQGHEEDQQSLREQEDGYSMADLFGSDDEMSEGGEALLGAEDAPMV